MFIVSSWLRTIEFKMYTLSYGIYGIILHEKKNNLYFIHTTKHKKEKQILQRI
jgi:predicted ATP-grasp superfamily ATP-dependent carboligase